MNFRHACLDETYVDALHAKATTLSSLALASFLLLAGMAGAAPLESDAQDDPVAELADEKGISAFLPGMKQLTAPFRDQTQCRVRKGLGVRGMIATSATALEGPFLAIWWDANGLLVATLRSTASLPVESFTLRDEGRTEIILLRRNTTIYAYAMESGVDEPLVAVDFGSVSDMVVGALMDQDDTEQSSAFSAVVAAPTLTGDLLQKQNGTRLAGDWTAENDPGSLGETHLVNQGDDSNASATVKVENLLPGTHELWIRYAAAPFHTPDAEVTVEGFGKPASLVVNQRISGGLWLPLGRFEAGSVTSATIRLAPGSPGSGSLSLDAVHEVWSFWADANKDQLPDALEGANARNPLVKDGASSRKDVSSSGDVDFSSSESPSLTAVDRMPVSDGSKSVIYVHSALGSDSFDGRSDKPQAGAWFSVRGGPKKTIGAALKSATRSVKVLELHLDGRLEPPAGGFQDLGNFVLVLVPGKNGASLESSSVAPPSSHPLPPPERGRR